MTRALDLAMQFLTFMQENAFDGESRSAKQSKMGRLLPLSPSCKDPPSPAMAWAHVFFGEEGSAEGSPQRQERGRQVLLLPHPKPRRLIIGSPLSPLLLWKGSGLLLGPRMTSGARRVGLDAVHPHLLSLGLFQMLPYGTAFGVPRKRSLAPPRGKRWLRRMPAGSRSAQAASKQNGLCKRRGAERAAQQRKTRGSAQKERCPGPGPQILQK